MKHIARKRFGQNFLVDRGVIDAIVRAIDPQPNDCMVEIGPGLAALTEPLMAAKRAASSEQALNVVELDRDLVARLRKRFKPEQLVVHEADALKFHFAQLLTSPQQNLRVVGNLPYNISSPLLFHLMEIADQVRDQHFMLQKEVVERMVASHGDSEYGRLSVMLQVRYDMEMLFEVPPEAFDPPPKVTSAIVRMIPIPASDLKMKDEALFAKLVATAFSQRRKMLRNTLKDYAAAMEAVGIIPTARAEDVAVEDYVQLCNVVGSS